MAPTRWPRGLTHFEHRIARVLARVIFGCAVEGQENIPETGGALLVANHPSYFDPPIITSAIDRPVRFMAWDRLFRLPILGRVLKRFEGIPVNLDSVDTSSFRTALRALRDGWLVGNFPEAGRSLQRLMGAWNPGVLKMAERAGVPLLPVSVVPRGNIWPTGQKWPRLWRTRIIIHPIVPLPENLGANAEVLATFERKVRVIINGPLVAQGLERDDPALRESEPLYTNRDG